MGWGALAVPSDIVSAEFAACRISPEATTQICHECLADGQPVDANFCTSCGARLPPYQRE